MAETARWNGPSWLGATVPAAALAAAAVAFALRVYRLSAQSLWYDEGISLALAGRDLGSITVAAAADIHPPLYYYLLHFWTGLAGNGEFAARFLSAAAGVLAVALVYRLGRDLLSPAAGVVAAALMAASPLAVYYSQEARMYALLLALATAASIVWLRLLRWETAGDKRASWSGWAGYSLLGALCLYTHYFAVLLLPVHGLWTVIVARGTPRALGRWLGAQIAAVAAFVPWLLAMSFDHIRSFSYQDAVLPVGELAVRAFDDFTGGHLAEADGVVRAVAVVLVALGLFHSLRSGRGAGRGALLALAYFVLPVGILLASNMLRPTYQARLALLAAPGLYLLLAQGVLALRAAGSRLGGRGLASALGGTAFGAVAVAAAVWPAVQALPGLYHDQAWRRDDYRGVVRYIEERADPTDAIVLNSPWQIDIFLYYYQGDLAYYPLPTTSPMDRERTESDLAGLLERHGGVWAVLWGTSGPDPERFVEHWLDTHAFKTENTWFGGVRLARYVVASVGERQPADIRFGDNIHLRAYAWESRQGAPGEVMPLTLFWEASGPVDRRYTVFAQVLDQQEAIWGQRDSEPVGATRPTDTWEVGEVIEDRLGLPLRADVAPGTYQIQVGMYYLPTMERLPLFDAQGNHLGDRLLIGPIEVR